LDGIGPTASTRSPAGKPTPANANSELTSSGEAMPLVAVIIPTRNRFALTAEAIRSVQAQTYSNWELRLVDDASDDGSESRLRSLALADQRIRIITSARRGGESRARQIGLDESTAPLVAPLDSDDLWLPEKLEAQVAHLHAQSRSNANLGAVCCRSEWVTVDGGSLHHAWRPFQFSRRRTALPLAFGNMSASLFTREALVAAGGFESPESSRLTSAENIEFALRQLETSESTMVDRVLVICRHHPAPRASDSLGTRAAADGLARALDLHVGLRDRHPRVAALLLARVGARYLDAGDPIGYRYLSRAVRGSSLQDAVHLLLRYGPFAIRRLPRTVGASP
jgi:glycosyltransferase involved in cell wall biosynthesis